MFSERLSWAMLAFGFFLIVVAGFFMRFFPGYLTNSEFLIGIIFIEALLYIVWDYRHRFLPTLFIVFLGAGMKTPLQGVCSTARWGVLAVGAVAGLALFLNDRSHRFGIFHAVGLACIVSSFASSVVSVYPSIALLKAVSLLLLFVYAMSGARLVISRNADVFVDGLLKGFEVLLYCSAISYLIFHYPLLGNPNSLGATMGVMALPIMLWSVLSCKDTHLRRRRQFALILAVVLLLSSYSRASMISAFAVSALLCFVLRQHKFLVKGIVFVSVAAIAVASLVPVKSEAPGEHVAPLMKFLYKGHEGHDILQSRRSVWDQTVDSIRSHPYFGTGFGTSATEADASGHVTGAIRSSSDIDVGLREHGTSYLAIVEWQGLLGVVPFFVLIFLTAMSAGRLLIWIRQGGDAMSPAVPLAAVVVAGLIHAGFEDWMFAIGYYLSAFFWTLSFMLIDLVPHPVGALANKQVPVRDFRPLAPVRGR